MWTYEIFSDNCILNTFYCFKIKWICAIEEVLLMICVLLSAIYVYFKLLNNFVSLPSLQWKVVHAQWNPLKYPII